MNSFMQLCFELQTSVLVKQTFSQLCRAGEVTAERVDRGRKSVGTSGGHVWNSSSKMTPQDGQKRGKQTQERRTDSSERGRGVPGGRGANCTLQVL